MGFPLERGSVEDGILTCHWHHARFDLESGCTFDLWADDVPICPVEVRNGEVWVKTTFDHADPGAHWHLRLADGLAHDLGLVVAKAVHGQLAADVPRADIVRQVALFGAQNCDGWGVGLTILTALANLLPVVPEEEAYLALFHGARHVAADCDGQTPRRERAPLGSRPEPAALKRWLRRWTRVRHRDAAERTLLTAIAAGASQGVLADALIAAETERAFTDTGHSLDFTAFSPSNSSSFASLVAAFKKRELWVVGLFLFLYDFSPGLSTPLYYTMTDNLKFSQDYIGILGSIASAGWIVEALLYRRFGDLSPA